MSVVRENLLKDPNYAPFCVLPTCSSKGRMHWTGRQFRCRVCGNTTDFEAEFIDRVIAFRESTRSSL